VKAKTVATCQSCGAQMPRWMGRCPECNEWGSVVEELVSRQSDSRTPAAGPVETQLLASHPADAAARVPTGIDELDLVLGGGLVAAGIVLLAGEPGVGKSTLALQAALTMGARHEVLVVCGEEAPPQVRARAGRIGAIPESVRTMSDPQLQAVLGAMESSSASLVVIDSIQTMFDPDIPSAPGSVSQVRECGARLARAARDAGTTLVLVGHVTKEGTVAGPRVLEHLVDVVLHFEGDRSGGVRILRALKNRFGSTQEVCFFEMRSEGLVAIRDASAYLLADRRGGLPGSVLAACVDGRRPFVCEIQALVATANGPPRRSAVGIDGSRLPMLVAVLEQRAGVVLHDKDVFVSAVGGFRVPEPAVDLPVVIAVMSAVTETSFAEEAVAFGEIGLSGEVRQVVAADKRIAEASNVGCTRAFVPRNFSGTRNGIELHRLGHVRDALDAIGA
jgi:DNA repair protein RadA/Sms